MANLVAVDLKSLENLDNTTFYISTSSTTNCQSSDDLPLFADNGWDGVLVLSRENSERLVLSRENSEKLVLSRENSGVLGRETSQIFLLGKENFDRIILSRENSESFELSFGRENSGFLASLARETSSDFKRLVAASCGDSLELPPIKLEDKDSTTGENSDQTQPVQLQPVQLQPVSDQEQPCTAELMELVTVLDQNDGKCNRRSKARRARGAPAPQQRESKRGAHVRDRPDMQQTARDGAAHWAACVKTVRSAWAERASRRPAFRADYGPQVDSAHGRIKSKQESLLRFLQLSADDGLVLPGPFVEVPGGFFGWVRFAVAPGRAREFRRGLEALFPAGFREDTLKETFRRAGLIPERWQWEQAWRGGVPFEFRAARAGEDGGAERDEPAAV